MSTSTLKQMIVLVSWPQFTVGAWRYAHRGWLYLRQNWMLSLTLLTIEPLVAFVAIGWGMGSWVSTIGGRTYPVYLLPGIVSATSMWVAFWESGYGVLERRQNPSRYWVALQAPLQPGDLALGEILWASFKATLVGVLVMAIGQMSGYLPSAWAFLAPVFLFLNGLIFAGFGLLAATRVNGTKTILLIQIVLLGPLSFLSETFFPLQNLGDHWPVLGLFSPLTHSSQSLRSLFHGQLDSQIFLNLAVLFLLAVILCNLSSRQFQKLFPR